MYSEQLEQLIKSVIADGVITDKERAVLHKKAAAEGVDEDEIDVYVDGLVTQMKSEPQDSGKAQKNPKVNFNYVNKQAHGKHHYYIGKDYYEINITNNEFVEKIYLNFFKEIVEESIYFGIYVIFEYKKGWESFDNYPKIMLKTDRNSIDFVWEITKLEIPSRLIAKKSSFDLESYSGDEEMIKLLCDANTITISLYNCGVCRDNDWDIRNKFDIENISINDFKSNAQIFYGAVINYVGQEEDTVETYKEDVKNLTYARVLGTDTRYLKKDDEKSQIWDKYLDQETGYTIYHMKDCKSFIGFASKRIYNFEWQFHALEKGDCGAKYYFELICTCRDKEDNDGHRLPKKPFELAEGELQINVEGNDSPLIPLVNNLASFSIHQKKLRGDEHCYYEVPSALMESIVDSKKIKLKAFGSEHKSAKLRKYGIFVGSKMTKKWELAYKLIAHPDKKGKYLEEYHNYLLREKVWNYVKSIFAKF